MLSLSEENQSGIIEAFNNIIIGPINNSIIGPIVV